MTSIDRFLRSMDWQSPETRATTCITGTPRQSSTCPPLYGAARTTGLLLRGALRYRGFGRDHRDHRPEGRTVLAAGGRNRPNAPGAGVRQMSSRPPPRLSPVSPRAARGSYGQVDQPKSCDGGQYPAQQFVHWETTRVSASGGNSTPSRRVLSLDRSRTNANEAARPGTPLCACFGDGC